MSILFRRPSSICCFFCQSPCSIVRDPRNFQCQTCGCWNRYDEKGNIFSDEPAMHDESLNSIAFAKRGLPSKAQLPSVYGTGPFCHTCQTNQMLLVNLLSNYLPSPNNPEYARRLEELPEYKESLHVRYPPVCDSCLPAVEDEIRRKDNMARTKALGGWLKQSKGKERQRRVSETHKEADRIGTEMVLWRIRGILWTVSLLIAGVGNLGGALGFHPSPRSLAYLAPVLPLLVFLSLLWTVWDPTYSSIRRAQRQSRDVRVLGKRKYIVMQMTAWSSRLLTSCLVALSWYRPHLNFIITPPLSRLYFSFGLTLELAIIVASRLVLRLQQPPSIRLIDSNAHKHLHSRSSTPSTRPSTPVPLSVEPDILAALSLSTKPVMSPTNPIFGQPSLNPIASLNTHENHDTDAMDWTPTEPASSVSGMRKERAAIEDDSSWLRPQRFFPPEKPTGLEGLFERTLLMDDTSPNSIQSQRNLSLYAPTRYRYWRYSFLIPIIGLAYKACQIWKGV